VPLQGTSFGARLLSAYGAKGHDYKHDASVSAGSLWKPVEGACFRSTVHQRPQL